MRLSVNHNEVDLDSNIAVEILELDDRLSVRSASGVRTALSVRSGEKVFVSVEGRQFVIERLGSERRAAVSTLSGEIRASMPGAIAAVGVNEGQTVHQGQKLLVLEAMKTQQAFLSPFDGVVERLAANVGDQVDEGELLAVIRPTPVG